MRTLIAAFLLSAFASTVIAAQYNYIDPNDLRKRLSANDDLLIIDIQVEEEFNRHHIPGSLATHAYPVKSDQHRARLDPIVALQRNDPRPLIIVCPRGAGGAKRTYDYLAANGVDRDQLLILEKGMSGWDFNELTSAEN